MRDGHDPPWRGGGRGFLKGSERPEAGCLGEYVVSIFFSTIPCITPICYVFFAINYYPHPKLKYERILGMPSAMM